MGKRREVVYFRRFGGAEPRGPCRVFSEDDWEEGDASTGRCQRNVVRSTLESKES